ncbi:prevent-host-death family protein [Rhizobium sp. SG_E_25_P2]|jgi:prevent-host-death family protein|uniref:type II toxin-antitoxin system prevent-host-death family antitoxin n=1 Tax=Rhizobium sp. SG_E_25_P2 TaxID=2879942 RepID=UPI00247385A7|nr:type II toxin-antitoxin system prevent-host-death family antitoxin [Rhizobium sp. SG_E_25_P2]MDH6268010.1 prevent-host-death family protein [Rhizobium sp. SG_E_25_P2]
MGYPTQVSATTFAKEFGKYRDEAMVSGGVEVTSHGRPIGAYISLKELENYERLKKRERRVIHARDMDDETLSAIMNAEYGKASE